MNLKALPISTTRVKSCAKRRAGLSFFLWP